MRRRLTTSSLAAGIFTGIVAIGGCRASDGVGPRTQIAAWSRSSERQAEAVQAMLDGRKPLPPVPIVFIDGRRYQSQDSDARFSVIDPERIATIQTFTGAEAEARAGAAGRPGVIWITTKGPARR